MSRSAKLPVPVGRPYGGRTTPPPTATFEAQLLGQEGRKRGLRGGQPVLDAARSAYLEAEFCGEADRRPEPGLIARTKV